MILRAAYLPVGLLSVVACGQLLGIRDLSPPADAGSVDSGPPTDTGAPDADAMTIADSATEAVVDAPAEEPPDSPADTSTEDSSDGGCGDTRSSSVNCGSCGHSCLGGSCTMGRCDPNLLAQGFGPPFGIAVNGTRIYLAHTQAIWYCDVGGCGGNLSVQSGLPGSEQPTSLAQVGSKLYFTARWYAADGGNTGAVEYSDESLPGFAPSTLSSTPSLSEGIIQCGGSVCWVDGSGAQQRAYSCDTTAGCASPTLIASSSTGINGLATDGTTLFIATSVSIDTCPLAGCVSPSTLVPSQPNAFTLVYSNGHLFWASNDNTVMACTLPNCASTAAPIATGQGWPYAIAVDATTVYWANYGNPGTIMKCGIAGCAGQPTVVASGQAGPQGIAVDAARIYWYLGSSSPGPGALLWVAK